MRSELECAFEEYRQAVEGLRAHLLTLDNDPSDEQLREVEKWQTEVAVTLALYHGRKTRYSRKLFGRSGAIG